MPESQSLRPFPTSDLGERLDLFAAERARDPDPPDNPTRVEDLTEDLELGLRKDW